MRLRCTSTWTHTANGSQTDKGARHPTWSEGVSAHVLSPLTKTSDLGRATIRVMRDGLRLPFDVFSHVTNKVTIDSVHLRAMRDVVYAQHTLSLSDLRSRTDI